MTKQFPKKSIAVAVTTAALAFAAVTPVRAADQSQDWFEQQRSLEDGVGASVGAPAEAPPHAAKGPEGRIGKPAGSPEGQAGSQQQDWLIQQLRLSDGPPE
jgi:hypothetical protein